jgi:predicted nucleic acid-binding protein
LEKICFAVKNWNATQRERERHPSREEKVPVHSPNIIMRRQRRSQPRTTESELQHLRDSVHSLQKDAQDQLTLEMESQASFEHIYAQVSGLRSAFDTLSDVLLEEVDSLRAETSKRFDQLTLHVEKQDRVLANVSQDLSVLKRTIDVWGLKERDWAKDNEILKVSHSHNAEWMKTMQRDLMEVKDEMRAVKDDSSVAAKDLREESGSLRALWEQSLEKVNARTKELEASIDRQQVHFFLFFFYFLFLSYSNTLVSF